jgi:hypothetical protein
LKNEISILYEKIFRNRSDDSLNNNNIMRATTTGKKRALDGIRTHDLRCSPHNNIKSQVYETFAAASSSKNAAADAEEDCFVNPRSCWSPSSSSPLLPHHHYSYSSFHSWLQSQRKSSNTIREIIIFSKRFGHILDTADASPLMHLSPRNKQHALTALANLSKYTGRYDQFLQLRQRYNLKWSSGNDSMQSFERFFNEELTLDAMLQRIKETMEKLPAHMARIVQFACLVGLRPAEVIESVKLINDKEASPTYYNESRQCLEHYKFPSLFLRQTKKCYVSFVTSEIVDIVRNNNSAQSSLLPDNKKEEIPSYNAIRLTCRRRAIKCDLRFCRKIYGSWLRLQGIESEIVDLLQGRVPKSVFARHYFTPSLDYKARVLQAVHKLKHEIERY